MVNLHMDEFRAPVPGLKMFASDAVFADSHVVDLHALAQHHL